MIKIENISPGRIDEAVDLMLTAFKDEALTSSWLNLSDPNLKNAYKAGIRIIYKIHLDSGDPIYTATEEGRIVGFAALSTPYSKKSVLKVAGLLFKSLPRLLRLFPPVIKSARALFAAIKPPKSLPKNYCTLEAVAVDPPFQGKGIGTQLLKHVHDQHFGINTISGIYLVTGDEKNVNIYERFGYEVVDKRQTKRVTAFHMFKKNPQSG